ncbi:MAG: glycoside hydrolase family 19 protein [Caulobacteraceae bacterium]
MPTDPAAITAARLHLFAPQADELALASPLEAARVMRAVATPRRVRHFMAQTHVESAGFTRLSEGLFYTTAERVREVWPSRFPTSVSAEPYIRNPEKLANVVYGGRLGNTAAGDGFRYRGRGLIQITGRDNYARASDWVGQDLVVNPDLAATPKIAAAIAAAWWQAHGLNEIADTDAGERVYATLEASLRGNETDDLQAETKIINGGLNGWPQRQAQLLRAGAIWRDPI